MTADEERPEEQEPEDDIDENDEEAQSDGEQEEDEDFEEEALREEADEVPSPEQKSDAAPEPATVPWVDRWWVWALGALALAGFIGVLHLLSGGSGSG